MSNVDASVRTLCIVQQGAQVLLGFKKRGFGAGKWNGFGGKIEEDESLAAAARRELAEEAGLTGRELQPRGRLSFLFRNGLPPLEVYLFVVRAFVGEPRETDEMRPQWFSIAEIPYGQMWLDDQHWLPSVLNDRSVEGIFVFQDETTLVSWRVKEVASEKALRYIQSR